MFLKGSAEGPTKALKLTTYLEENVTGQCVQMLWMDKALKGRRETWQPAVQINMVLPGCKMIQLLEVNLL